MTRPIRLLLLAALCAAGAGCGPDIDALAAEIQAAGPVTYAGQVGPIVQEKCSPCHIRERKKGFSFASREQALDKAGAVLPGDGARSRVIERLTSRDKKKRMPPGGTPKISAHEIATIKAWIDSGAN